MAMAHPDSAKAARKGGFVNRAMRHVVVAVLLLSALVDDVAAQSDPVLPSPPSPIGTDGTLVPIPGQLILKLDQATMDQALKPLFKRKRRRPPTNRQITSAISKYLGVRSTELLPFGAVKVTAKRRRGRFDTSRLGSIVLSGGLEWIQNNYKVRAFNTPDDTFFALGLMWNLDNNGFFGIGKTNVDIDGPEAWNISTGGDVVVGVIDTGIYHKHPDLQANMWVNPGEVPGNRKDDDGNGFVDDVYGYDFVNEDGDPLDDMFHGTHCAGTIGGVGRNARGVPGVAWNIKLMGLKMLDSQGSGDTADAIRAIDYAIQMRRRGVNIRVLNASFGGGDHLPAFEEALRQANDAGIIFIAAAGNSGENNDQTPVYPANYRLPNVISVGALQFDGTLAPFSNFGATTVDVGAPGVAIWSTVILNFYFTFDGTSMAAPHVAGIAALLFAHEPNLTAAEARARILATAKPIAGLEGKLAVPGIVSAYHALSNTPGLPIQ